MNFILDYGFVFSEIILGILGVIGLIYSLAESKIRYSIPSILCFGLFIFWCYLYNTSNIDYEISNSYDIVALQDESQIEGNRYNIKTTEYYKVMRKYGNTQEKIPSNETDIIYDGNNKVVEYKPVYKNEFISRFFMLNKIRSSKYKIYVSENTVKNNFNIDLSNN